MKYADNLMLENVWNPYLVVHCLLLVSTLQATLASMVEATTKEEGYLRNLR